MELTKDVEIVRYKEGEFHEVTDIVVEEYSLRLLVNGVRYVNLFCSPDELEELVLGYLYGEGVIGRLDEVSQLTVDRETGLAEVLLADRAALAATLEDGAEVQAIQSGNGKQHGLHLTLKDRKREPYREGLRFSREMLLENLKEFYRESTLHKATAGVHRCALCDDSGTLLAAIDISRHNAFDKVLGKALQEGISLADKYIITSGRVPSDMVNKAVNAGSPMLVSRSAPTDAAVKIAKEKDLTLLGFSKEDRFNVYSGFQRIV